MRDFEAISELKDVNGVQVADYDLDGDLDVYVVSIHQFEQENPQTWSRLLRNDQENGFTDVTIESKLFYNNHTLRNGWMGDRMAASWGDYNNDGFPDLFLANNGEDELWRNDGKGAFINVTEKAGIKGCIDCYSSNGLWWDYDIDGDLDLFVSNWRQKNRLHRNEGNGTFTDVSLLSGLGLQTRAFAGIPVYVNEDPFPDLYIVNDFGANIFFLNNGDGTFLEATATYGLEDDGDGMGVDICDFNNDGNFDIYVTNIYAAHPNPFFVNNGDGKFINLAKELGIENTGWGWGARFFDADHDMDEDLYVVNGMSLTIGLGDKNFFFENREGFFWDVSADLGVNNEAEARGLEVFDFDMDGDLDMLVGNRQAPLSFYQNTWMESNPDNSNWIQIQLEGTTSNKNGVGSIVEINCEGRFYYRQHSGVNLFGQSIKPIHFGLAGHDQVDEIAVIWPTGQKEYYSNILANQIIKLKEGEGRESSALVVNTNMEKLIEGVKVFPNPF